MTRLARPAAKDFFISYAHADRKWAEWIASVLESDNHKTVIQSWDFGPGCNFVLKMHDALQKCRRLVLVYSPAYFESLYAQAEWAGALATDPTGEERTLLPVRVSPCKPAGLLKAVVYCDLVGLAEDEARERLLLAARPPRRKSGGRGFPGMEHQRSPNRCDLVRELCDILSTTLVTFNAQSRIRDLLVAAMSKRLKLKEKGEYESFFHKRFRNMVEDERRQHSIIRGYTKTVLHEYNTRALELSKLLLYDLEDEIPSLLRLCKHLTIWLARYKTVMRLASTCLVYVAVDEGAGFPKEVDNELRDFLASHCGGPVSRRRRRVSRESED